MFPPQSPPQSAARGVLGESWRITTERVFTGELDLDNAEQLADLVRTFTNNMKNGTGAPATSDIPPVQPAA